MPYKKPVIEKIQYTISEVAEIVNIDATKIRYWENQFEALKPKKNNKGNRLFSKEDIELVKLINHLVKERGLTIKGAKMKLKENREDTIHTFEIVNKLQSIKKELTEIRDEMEEQND